MRKKELELILEELKPIEKPKVKLEQYTIPSYLAAEILNLAFLNGDIKNKVVFDLGCGSGRLTIGAALLGAKKVIGIDKDVNAIKIAKANLKLTEKLIGKKLNVKFFVKDVSKLKLKCDTVIQNPPFGTKGFEKDVIFLEKALEIGKKIYSLHKNGRRKTRKFLMSFIEENEGKIEKIAKFKFFLPHIFKFHKKLKIKYDVDLYVISKTS
jgi:putative methylase